jgi:hypothetical protein
VADFGTLVLDGAVDRDRFDRAQKRIVWLLREVNDPEGNLTDLRSDLKEFADQLRIAPAWTRTFCAVARVSYGLLHPTDPWERWCKVQSEFSTALGDVAVINIKKTAGGASARWNELAAAFKANEEQLRLQLGELKPDIVIGGNVMWFCRDWLGGWDPRFAKDRNAPYPTRCVGGILWVHAHHPNQRGSHRAYFERIVSGIMASTQQGVPQSS